MSQQVQELIEKIKSEGVEAAQQKSGELEQQAKQTARKIIHDAKEEAQHIVISAKQEAKKLHESTQTALKQAARDTLLALRKEIDQTLHKVISTEVNGALTPEYLSEILSTVISNFLAKADGGTNIEIALNAKDFKKLEEGFLAKLTKEVKQSVKLSTSQDIGKGFTISFDSGKSCFDFTDQSLAEYLSTHLNERVTSLFQRSEKAVTV